MMKMTVKGLILLDDVLFKSGYSLQQVCTLIPSEDLVKVNGQLYMTKGSLITLMLSNPNQYGRVNL